MTHPIFQWTFNIISSLNSSKIAHIIVYQIKQVFKGKSFVRLEYLFLQLSHNKKHQTKNMFDTNKKVLISGLVAAIDFLIVKNLCQADGCLNGICIEGACIEICDLQPCQEMTIISLFSIYTFDRSRKE